MIEREEFELAFYAAKGAYELDAGGGFLKHLGYEFVENGIWTIEQTGLKAALYSDGTGNYVLAFAGTEGSQDWYQNVSSLGYGQWESVRQQIFEMFNDINFDVGDIATLTVTGHSLGGALAQYAAYEIVSEGKLAANQIDLLTFNGLGGEASLDSKHSDYDKDLLADADIYHYYEPSDLVVQLSEHVGGQTSNYQLSSSTEAEFFLDAHSLATIELQMKDGSVLIDSQANHHYFNLDDILPLVQALSSGTNGLLGGGDQEISEMEAMARLFTILPGISLIEAFPLKSSEYTELRDWVLDNVAETVLDVTDPTERAVTVFGLGAAIGALSTGLNFSRLPLLLEAGSQLTASYLEYLNANNDQPDATTPAKDALAFSLFSILSGGRLNDQGGMEGGTISRVEVNHILEGSAPHEAQRYSEVFQAVADILGENVEDGLKGYIDFHHTLLSQGIHFSTVADARGVDREQLEHWLNQSGYFDLDARLARYSVINNLPFILMGPELASAVSSEIRESDRYAKDTYSEPYWVDRLNFYELTLSQNRENLPYGDGLGTEYALFKDLQTGDIAKNYLFADKVNTYTFGTEDNDTSGLEGGEYHDHLYGNGGDDILFGREGEDVLDGGKGNDHLHGGTGNDFLVGGADNDTYHFTQGHGYDRIEDTEGINTLIIGGRTITALEKVSGTEDSYKNALDENDPYRYQLTVSGFRAVGANGDIVDVIAQSDFSRFGINVENNEPEPSPAGGDIVVGSGHNYDGVNNWAPSRGGTATIEDNIFYDASLYDADLYNDGYAGNDWEFWGSHGNDYLKGGVEDDVLKGNLGDDDLLGGEGNDELFGHAGKDNLVGGTGNDTLVGGSGSDTLSGGEGIDFIFGNGPYINIDAETGEVLNEAGTDVGDVDIVDGGAGNDRISSGKYTDILSGGAGEDQIYGGEGNDVIDGGADNDFIMGDSAGNRVRYTEPGLGGDIRIFTITDHIDRLDESLSYNDTIDGGQGDDIILGEAGDDTIDGGDGDDYIEGDKSNDNGFFTAEGQYLSYTNKEGVERLITADDYVEFQEEWSGNDTLKGGAGVDTIYGNGGNDTLHGGSETDWLYGGTGSDTINGDEGSDVLYGDEGNDRLNGGEQHDWLYGGEGDDQLYGGAGNDQIQGGKGDDVLSGGSGTDRLDGGAGNDTFIVKPGDGTIYITDTQGINILAFEGGLNAGDIYTYARPSSQDPTSDSFIKINYGSNESDVIAMSQTTFSYIREARFADGSSLSLIVDNLSNGTNLGTDSDDHITSDGVGSKHYYGFSGADTIDAGDGQDYVYGGDDNDAINGNSGDDYLYGDVGDDVIAGGEGDDVIFGGAGNDTYLYSLGDGADYISTYDETEGRQDVLVFDESIAAQTSYVTRSGDDLKLVLGNDDSIVVESFFKEDDPNYALTAINFSDGTSWDSDEVRSRIQAATPYDDVVQASAEGEVISGLAGNDTITGQEGNDQFFGDEGNDILSGNQGSDELNGGDGQDTLYGNDGDDTLIGGNGDDYLYGGAGHNIYHYALGDGNDQIRAEGAEASHLLIFSETVDPSEIDLVNSYDDLIITLTASGETIEVFGFFDTDPSQRTSLSIQFDATSSTWSDSELRTKTFEATAGNDTIQGTADADTLSGLAGDDNLNGLDGDDILLGGEGRDTLNGGTGNDTLDGGAGDDSLTGGLGNDTYLYGIGSGHDIIDFDSNSSLVGSNTVMFDESIQANDLELERVKDTHNSYRDHLLITVKSTGETLTVARYFSNSSDDTTSTGQVSTFEFSDGSEWAETDIYALIINSITEGDDYFVAGDADDEIDGLAGNDSIVGGQGNDHLSGGQGDDSLLGYSGADQLFGNSGNDWLYGGEGNDELNGGAGNDYVNAGDGDDTVSMNVGEGHDEVVFGGGLNTLNLQGDIDASDIEFRMKGRHSLFISAGEALDWSVEVSLHFDRDYGNWRYQLDHLLVNDTEVEITDTIGEVIDISGGYYNGSGYVVIRTNETESWNYALGTEGDDLIFGTDDVAMFDELEGGAGNDQLYGKANNDILRGGEGHDVLSGGAGDDELYGGDGQDTLISGKGNDRLMGGFGGDVYRIYAGSGVSRISDFSEDFNIIEIANDLSAQNAALHQSGDDLMISFETGENVIVSNYFDSGIPSGVIDEIRFADNTVWESAYVQANVEDLPLSYDGQAPAGFNVVDQPNGSGDYIGTNDDDFIEGTGDQEVVYGSWGRDIIVGFGGSDELVGSSGGDLIIGDGLLFGNEGDDILESRNMSNDNYDGRAFMFGGDGDDTYRVGINSVNTFIYNGSEAGHYGASFSGGPGGSASDFDVLEFMEGISPDDINFYANGYGLELEIGNNGYVVTLADYFEPLTYQGKGIGETAPVDEIRFADGTVWNQNDITDMLANAPVDQDIEGTSQADTLLGGAGDDWIAGFEGDDTLYGEGGDDILVGGAGNDTLYGGSGEDDYDFDPGFGQDVIYNTGSDYNEIWLYQVNESDVAYAKQGNDLVVSIIGTSDQITVKDWYESPERKVVVYFDDLDITHSIDHIESLATDESSSSNSEPTALADTANTEEDTSIIIDVLANDSDIDGDSLSISSASASYGSVLINGDGTLNYTPNADFNGLDSISYEVSDGNGSTATSSVFVTVNPENDAPVAVFDTAATQEDTSVTIDVLANDSDIDGDSLSVSSASAVSGAVVINGDGTLSYSPNADFNGLDSISYEISDGNGGTMTSSVSVTVNPENDAPVAVADAAATQEDTSVTINVLANDGDIDGDSLSISSASASNGAVVINGDGTLNYTPNADFNGLDSISYEISDGNGGTGASSVSVTVNPENDVPVAVVDTAVTQEDASVTIDVLANDGDIDGDSLSISSASASNGAVAINGDGTLSYAPNSDFNGLDSISYEVSDGNGGTATSSVSVTVNPENDAPVSISDTAVTDEDTAVVIDVLVNDRDIDGDSLSVVAAAAISGVVAINGDGTISYTPSANFVGEDSITYEVSDGNGGVANSTVAVTVNSTEDDPITIVGTGAAETLEGGNNNDNLAAKGGKDVLYGYEGNDTLHGGGGADSLYGGLGADTLKGANGSDKLYGNEGNDLLVGGKGHDTYYYQTGDGYDRINNASNNFATDTDKLSLESVGDVDDVWFKKTNNHLDIYVLGSEDHVRVNNWYKADKFKLDSIEAGGQAIDAINIEQLVSAMASFGAPSGGSISLNSDEQNQVDTAIATAWA